MALLCKVAVENDPVDAAHLMESESWRNLTAMLEATGERPLKRTWHQDLKDDDESYPDRGPGTPSEQLAKRFKQAASLQS